MDTSKIVQEHSDVRLDTAETLAFALNVSKAWVRKHTRQGLPHFKLGGATRYNRTVVMAYLKDRQEG